MSSELPPVPVLPVVRADGGSSFTYGKMPAWPVTGDAELDALARLARASGAELRVVDARAGRTKAVAGVVAALGAPLAAAAEAYAHLTFRSSRVIERRDELAAVVDLDVVVVGDELLDEALCELLAALPRAVGIVHGSGEALRRRVMYRSAAAFLTGRRAGRIDVLPLARIAALRRPGHAIFGALSEPALVRAALRANAGCLVVHSHSDGVDAMLVGGQVLCRAQDPPAAANAHSPRCELTGFCHRTEMPVEEAFASGLIVAPAELACELAVLSVCFGSIVPGYHMDPRWGLLDALADNPQVSAVATTWMSAWSSMAAVERLVEPLRRGASAGEALRVFNDDRVSRTEGASFVLFGDPSIRPRAESIGEPLAAARTTTSSLAECQAAEHDLATLDAAARYLAAERKAPVQRAARALRAAVREYAGALRASRSVPRADELAGPRLRERVLRACVAGYRLEGWMALAEARETAVIACGLCGGLARETRYDVTTTVAVSARIARTCPRCGLTYDVAEADDVVFAVRDNAFVIEDERWLRGAAVATFALGWLRSESAASFFPRSAGNVVPLPRRLPTGPTRVALFLARGTQFAVLSANASASRPVVNLSAPALRESEPAPSS